MLTGFDYPWWSAWADAHIRRRPSGPTSSAPASRSRTSTCSCAAICPPACSRCPIRREPTTRGAAIDPTVLALGVAYLVLQVFLSGGVIAVLRAPQPEWTVRGLLHGSGFYFGRLLRLALLMLLVDAVVFALYGPFARWADVQAREAVSERTAIVVDARPPRPAPPRPHRGEHGLVLRPHPDGPGGAVERDPGPPLRGRALRGELRADVRARAADDRGSLWRGSPRGPCSTGTGRPTGYKTQLVTFVLLEGLVFAAPLPPRGDPGWTGDPGSPASAGGPAERHLTLPTVPVDATGFRQALSQFASGVTVVTTRDASGEAARPHRQRLLLGEPRAAAGARVASTCGSDARGIPRLGRVRREHPGRGAG